jgi:hypothetical protein
MVGAFDAGVGGRLAAGAGVGADVFGVEDRLNCPPAIAIFRISSRNACRMSASMPEFYSVSPCGGKRISEFSSSSSSRTNVP